MPYPYKKINIKCPKCKVNLYPREFRMNRTDLEPWQIGIYFKCEICEKLYEVVINYHEMLNYLDYEKIGEKLQLDELVNERYIYYQIDSIYDKRINGCNSGVRPARKSEINTQTFKTESGTLILHRPEDYNDEQMWFEVKMFHQMIYDKLANSNFDDNVDIYKIQEMIENYGKENKEAKGDNYE